MLKTSFTPSHEQYLLRLPRNFVGKKVEVIAYTEEELKTEETARQQPLNFLALNYSTKGFRFDRDEANRR